MIKNRTYKGYKVDGDLTIGHDANVCGSLAVSKDAVFKGAVRINGILAADNVDCCNKGFFPNATELEKAYPTPKPGWWAIVGESLPGDIYSCSSVKTWKNTGIKGSPLDDHSDYLKLMEEIESIKDQVFQLEANLRHNQISDTLLFDGNEKTIELSFDIKKGGYKLSPDSIIIEQITGICKKTLFSRTKEESGIEEVLPYSGSILTTIDTLGTTTFRCTFSYNGITKSESIQIKQALPVFIGVATSQFGFTKRELHFFDKILVTSSESFTHMVNINYSDMYIYICIPVSMSLEDVKLSGIDAPFDVHKSSNYAINGINYGYLIYRTSGSPINGAFNLEFIINN